MANTELNMGREGSERKRKTNKKAQSKSFSSYYKMYFLYNMFLSFI